MDIKRQAIEEIKRQINEGRFKSNNELVLAPSYLVSNELTSPSGSTITALYLLILSIKSFRSVPPYPCGSGLSSLHK